MKKKILTTLIMIFSFYNYLYSFDGELGLNIRNYTGYTLTVSTIDGEYYYDENLQIIPDVSPLFYEFTISESNKTIHADFITDEQANEGDIDDYGNRLLLYYGLYEFTLEYGSNIYWFRIDYRDCEWAQANHNAYFPNNPDGDLYFYIENNENEWTRTVSGFSSNFGIYTNSTFYVLEVKIPQIPSVACFDVDITLRNIVNQNDYGILYFNTQSYSSGSTVTTIPGEYEFSTYTGLIEDNQKFRQWDLFEIDETYINPEIIDVNSNGDISANFYQTYPVTVANNFEGGTGSSYDVEWVGKFPPETFNSGENYYAFDHTNNQDVYNLEVPLIIEPLLNTDWYFYYWNEDIEDTNPQKSNLQITEPISFTANYKGHFRSNKTNAYDYNNQRKLVRTTDGYYHTVYESYNEAWYTYSLSPDFSGEWHQEISIDYDCKNPSIDYFDEELVITHEMYDSEEDDYLIQLLIFQSGDYTNGSYFTAGSISPSYFGQAKPVVAFTKKEIFVIWKSESGSALKYRILVKDTDGYWGWLNTENTLPNTNLNSKNPTIAGKKLNDDYYSDIHIAWQYGTNSIKYIKYDRKGGARSFINYQTASSGGGFWLNQYPSISLYDGTYPILSWTGSKKDDEVLGPKGTPIFWVHRAVVRPLNQDFYNTGWEVNFTNNNSCNIGGSRNTIITYSYSNGNACRYIKREESGDEELYFVGELEEPGIQTQVSNGENLGQVKAMVFDNSSDVPYQLQRSNTNFGSAAKPADLFNITYGRKGVVVKNEIEFVFYTGDILLDGNIIEFIHRQDTSGVQTLEELNEAMYSEPFVLNSNSDIVFSNMYYVVDADTADSLLLTANDAVTFKMELVNVSSGQVIATFDEVTYNINNLEEHNNLDYHLNCSGIANDSYYFRLVTEVQGEGSFFLGNVHNDISYLAKKSYNQVNISDFIQPLTFALKHNYPNPFNPVTKIEYEIPQPEDVSLIIYDIQGRVVNRLVDENKEAGRYFIHFDGSNLSSGIYFYKLTAGKYKKVRKMMLVK